MKWTEANWRAHAKTFPGFLAPFAQPMGRSERREGAALYVEGLLLPGERKSIEPMAERLGVDSQKLQQLVTDSPWDDQEVWRAIRQVIPTHLEPLWAWIVDETGWLKQGAHSVGVAHQYCGAEGKSANCQVNVEVAVTDGQVAVPIGARLYGSRAYGSNAGVGHSGNREEKVPCSSGTCVGSSAASSVPKSKGTSIGRPSQTTEENPAGRRLRPEKKEEESSANLSKKTQRKKILFLATRFASVRFHRWQKRRECYA
jgi:hypothetical protein